MKKSYFKKIFYITNSSIFYLLQIHKVWACFLLIEIISYVFFNFSKQLKGVR